MRSIARALALLFPLLAAGRAGQIAGTAVSAQSGEPLASVELTLSPIQSSSNGEQGRGSRGPRGPGGPSSGPSARTSLDGRFVFDDVAPGDYVIGASKAGYEGGGRIAKRVSLADSAPSESLTLVLNRSAAVEGRVVDSDGDPQAGARIELRVWTMADGQRVLRPVRSANTDDLGAYRIYNLTPGRYLVYLHPTSLGAAPGGVILETAGAYYPSGSMPAEGAKLNLAWGAELKGVDFVAAPAGAALVSGTVFREDGTPCADCSVTIQDAAGQAAASTRVSGAGRFAVHGLPAGEYTFVAREPRGSGRAGESLYLPDGRPVELSLRLAPGRTVSGAISLENVPDDGAEGALERASVRLVPEDATLAGQPRGARLRPDGGFAIEATPRGMYRAAVNGLPSNGYISRVLLGGAELPDGRLHVSGDGPVVGLALVASLDGGAIQGRAMAADGKSPAPPDGMVFLLPLSGSTPTSREQSNPYRGSDVSFQFRGVAPGEYLVFSAPRSFAWDASDAALMAEIRRRAERVEVRANETAEADAPFLDAP